MLDKTKIVILNRATPNREYLRKLRPRDNKNRVIKQISIRQHKAIKKEIKSLTKSRRIVTTLR